MTCTRWPRPCSPPPPASPPSSATRPGSRPRCRPSPRWSAPDRVVSRGRDGIDAVSSPAPSYHLVRPAEPSGSDGAVPALDEAQRRVVDHRGGPLLVLAGPGTGKTTTLVEAVVDRVGRGVPVDNILMLTFSRRAATEMRDRVAARLDRTIREPVARTLHSYAFGLLRMAAVRDGAPPPRLLASAEQDVIIRELLADGDPDS